MNINISKYQKYRFIHKLLLYYKYVNSHFYKSINLKNLSKKEMEKVNSNSFITLKYISLKRFLSSKKTNILDIILNTNLISFYKICN